MIFYVILCVISIICNVIAFKITKSGFERFGWRDLNPIADTAFIEGWHNKKMVENACYIAGCFLLVIAFEPHLSNPYMYACLITVFVAADMTWDVCWYIHDYTKAIKRGYKILQREKYAERIITL